MRKITILFVFAVLLLAATFGMMKVASGQRRDGGQEPRVLQRETQGDNVREVLAPSEDQAPEQPDIGFIDSPTVTCYQPDVSQDACYINWYYSSVSASPNYIVTMTMEINTLGPIAHMAGFFQTSMYVPYNMFPEGFKVACGEQGAGGRPRLGNAYAWTIRARDSAGLKAANYGTVNCPAYTP
ncbi:MAG TPA: hypothetical protein VE553_07675 [Candidatus Binatia bacterium]|jgi:hypothetical protein|nr:hypothetical protein [Candidatus Binatia bacterium]